MKISEGWLREHLDTSYTFEQITYALADIGLEVEEIFPPRLDLEPFKSALILSTQPHPHAQKLQICQVRTDQGPDLTIVCGAPNARSGLKVVLAPVGALIPSSKILIQKTLIRGIESEGMLCSAKELGVGKEEDGIIELSPHVDLGEKYVTLCGFDEGIWDINITPNRGDCFSVRGIARDLAAKGIGTLRRLKEKNLFSFPQSQKSPFPLPEGCSLFIQYSIQNIQMDASPSWVKRRLNQVGLTSRSPVVDILQWIMWDQGQPMHAYDADTLEGPLRPEILSKEEMFEGLNGKTYALMPGDLVIRDDQKTVALARILGSAHTACSSSTKNICLEGAFFSPQHISRTGQRLSLTTDARSRFERGIDPKTVEKITPLAASWILEICGGKASEIWVSHSLFPAPPLLFLTLHALEKMTGVTSISLSDCVTFLTRLGCTLVSSDSSQITLYPPSWRYDLKAEEDLVEEVLRLWGYDHIPLIEPSIVLPPPPSPSLQGLNRIRQTLAYQGYTEVVNWSFTSDQKVKHLGLDPQVRIKNPISQELNVLRPSLLPQLLDQLSAHKDRGLKKGALFEIGPVFQGIHPQDQTLCVGGVCLSEKEETHWHRPPSLYDLFDLKGDVWRLIQAWGLNPQRIQLSQKNIPSYYHPGQSAVLCQGPQKILGVFGTLHPRLQKIWSESTPLLLFEMWIDRWPEVPLKTFRSPWHVSPYPAVWRDFCFIIDKKVLASDLLKTIATLDPRFIRDVCLFDRYEDPSWKGESISYAVRVCLQSDSSTLTDPQIQEFSEKIIQKVSQTWGGTLRSA